MMAHYKFLSHVAHCPQSHCPTVCCCVHTCIIYLFMQAQCQSVVAIWAKLQPSEVISSSSSSSRGGVVAGAWLKGGEGETGVGRRNWFMPGTFYGHFVGNLLTSLLTTSSSSWPICRCRYQKETYVVVASSLRLTSQSKEVKGHTAARVRVDQVAGPTAGGFQVQVSIFIESFTAPKACTMHTHTHVEQN